MTRPVTTTRILLLLTALTGLLLLSSPVAAIRSEPSESSSPTQSAREAPVLGADALDLEQESRGYSTEYIFGMSKAIRRSTLHPALKPAAWLFTVPLDIVLLPFAALGGLF